MPWLGNIFSCWGPRKQGGHDLSAVPREMKPSRGSERNGKVPPWKEHSSCYVNVIEGEAAENKHIKVEFGMNFAEPSLSEIGSPFAPWYLDGTKNPALPPSITRIESAAYEVKPEPEEGYFTVITAGGRFPRKLTFDEVQCVSGGAMSLKRFYHST